ncbi:MAG: anthranilate synthase component I family protein [Bacteroidaceae bacterium]|nr:anthranilate synthase component I family protein [Bacteroidaceae bacterium]
MAKYNYRTATQTLLGDLLTPVSAYLKVRDAYPQSVLMESSDYHGGENARSFIALHPIGSVSISHGMGRAEYPDGSVTEHPITKEYSSAQLINNFLTQFEVTGKYSNLCGLFGYTSFNAVHYFENISIKDETQEKDDAPDLMYILYKDVVIFDHFNNELILIEMLAEGEEDDLDQLERDLKGRPYQAYGFRPVGDCASTLSDDEHRENIRRGIRHCLRGDVFQIVLSRRFVQHYEGDDFKLYRALRYINPSPYLFYFDFGGFRIFGSSPETHCRIERREHDEAEGRRYTAYIDPIAGTTRRTGDSEQDRRNAEYLRNNPKENAEHVMLVDLARNDLSRNCHDVHLDFFKDMQFYSHVIHLVSRVRGELDQEADPIQTFIDTFPAGTLSGAPKVRAMQLISAYEPHNRGAYGGCIGFIGFSGNLNQAITIRTFVSRNNELWFQAGGGIVANSDVEYELQEVNNKLGALRKAILLAEKL